MWDWLEQTDIDLFLYLNSFHTPFWDQVMTLISEKLFWIPVYLIFLFMILRKFGWKVLLWSLLFTALVITFCDQLSVKAFKDVVMRYRPCKNLEIGHLVHHPTGCGGKFGFVSSHAANFFGVATFIGLLFKKNIPWFFWILMLWAALIGYSRIYLGKHYPLDVIGGAMLGLLIGGLVYILFRKSILERSNLKNAPSSS